MLRHEQPILQPQVASRSGSSAAADMKPTSAHKLPHVVVIGGGFAGVQGIRNIPPREASITLIVRQSYSVVMVEVTNIDLATRRVTHSRGSTGYDYLVVAAGGVTSYFTNPARARSFAVRCVQ